MKAGSVLLLIFILWPAAQAQNAAPSSGVGIRFQLTDNVAEIYPIHGSKLDFGFTVSPLQTKDHKYSTLISMIHLSAQRQGDQWDISVSVTLPTDERKVLASARVGEGDSIRVDKFADYELVPGEVSIVRIDPVPADSLELVNRAPSIKFEAANPNAIPSPYRLTFTNLSNKRVHGIQLRVRSNRNQGGTTWLKSNFGEPLIEPGAIFRHSSESVNPADYKFVDKNEYQPIQSRILEITSVVFADGTYEGNIEYAAILNAEAVGVKRQIDRVLPLINRAIDSGDSDSTTLAKLKESIVGLDSAVEPADIEELRNRLQTLDESAIQKAQGSIGWGMGEVKTCLKQDLAERKSTITVHEWLVKEADKLRQWKSLFQ